MADTSNLTVDSKERVALELMHTVHSFESVNEDRAYWLTLYSQCLGVVNHGDPQKVLGS